MDERKEGRKNESNKPFNFIQHVLPRLRPQLRVRPRQREGRGRTSGLRGRPEGQKKNPERRKDFNQLRRHSPSYLHQTEEPFGGNLNQDDGTFYC